MSKFILPNQTISGDIEQQFLYQTPLFKCELYDIDNRALEEEIYSIMNNDFGIEVSNSGGWHSKVYSFDENFLPVVRGIQKILPQLQFAFDSDLDLKDIDIWANVNEPNSWNTPHTHPGAHLSGVYYVKVPYGDCGSIEFDDPREAISYGDTWFVRTYRGKTQVREPREGEMYIFPSGLRHWVHTNKTNQDRISISFNLYFK